MITNERERERHAIANTMVGVVLFFVLLASVLHYSGAWYSQFLPMSDSNTYDNHGQRYDVSRILTADYTLDVDAYERYSPLFLRYFPFRSRVVSWVVEEDTNWVVRRLPSRTACPLPPSPRWSCTRTCTTAGPSGGSGRAALLRNPIST